MKDIPYVKVKGKANLYQLTKLHVRLFSCANVFHHLKNEIKSNNTKLEYVACADIYQTTVAFKLQQVTLWP